ncbi:MAG: hypothetical protein HYX75_12845 [Acidobacteria bacterium]|nr:hypothetical protein [Acidobacteriota bacterium]
MIVILALIFCLRPGIHATAGQPDALAVIDEFDRMAAIPLWPGFDPRGIPLAIYDGQKTLLLRHPHPPVGFVAVPDRRDLTALPGRHPAILANSSAEIGGVQTATLLLSLSASRTPREIAAVAIHETFHVFQKRRHDQWDANEADLFTYPATDAELLTLRRLESECLRGALSAVSRRGAACWSVRALAYRAERFRRMPAESSAYERGTEIKEGLAQYVQFKALGSPSREIFGEGDLEDVRLRGYAAGEALGCILDRLDPDWHATLERAPAESLDHLVALAVHSESGEPCQVDAATEARIRDRARGDVEASIHGRIEARNRFLSEPGWRIEVRTAPGDRLWPKGFDPMNVTVTGKGEVLHTRFLNVGNSHAEIEILDHASLTAAAGEHPLFDGIASITICGLPTEPVISETTDAIAIDTAGVTLRAQGARWEKNGQVVTIRIGAAKPESR